MRDDLFFFFDLHLSFLSVHVLFLSQFDILQFLGFCDFILSHFLIVRLLFSHDPEFFFFQHFHSGVLEGFAA